MTPIFASVAISWLENTFRIMVPINSSGDKLMTETYDRFGSVAVIQTHSSRMAALGWKADVRSGRMSALTNTGRS
jgi:hypothetical protein